MVGGSVQLHRGGGAQPPLARRRSSIVAITSTTKALRRVVDGKPCLFRVHTWNPTVANLTLMALGSSAPEILLSLIELVFGDFFQASSRA